MFWFILNFDKSYYNWSVLNSPRRDKSAHWDTTHSLSVRSQMGDRLSSEMLLHWSETGRGERSDTLYRHRADSAGPGTASATMRSLILTIHTRQKNSVIWLYVVLETNIIHLKKCQHVAPSCLGYVYLKILFLQAFYLTIMIMSSKSQP